MSVNLIEEKAMKEGPALAALGITNPFAPPIRGRPFLKSKLIAKLIILTLIYQDIRHLPNDILVKHNQIPIAMATRQ